VADLRRFFGGALAAALLVAAPAAAKPVTDYTGLYVFGDSLVDAGNARAAARAFDVFLPGIGDPAPAERGYYRGRFSNGHTYADLLSLEATGRPSARVFPYGYPLPFFGQIRFGRPDGNALNFAYGGAQAIRGDERVPAFKAQVDAYRSLPGGADPDALYLVTFGGNDLFQAVNDGYSPEETSGYLGRVADRIADQIGRLEAMGARHILVTGAPDVGLVPRYAGSPPELREAASRASLELDLLMRAALGGLTAGGFAADLDYFSFLEFGASLGGLGLDFDTPCLSVVAPGPDGRVDCAGFAFFDELHPTAEVHALIYERMRALLIGDEAPRLASAEVPEPVPFALIGGGLVVLGLTRRRAAS